MLNIVTRSRPSCLLRAWLALFALGMTSCASHSEAPPQTSGATPAAPVTQAPGYGDGTSPVLAGSQPPGAPTAGVASAPLSTPNALALPCTADANCLTHRCNIAAGRCAWPCQTDNDCMPGSTCIAPTCLPKLQ